MLMRNPKEFERVAREWSITYAGAPRKQVGESSGGATDESIRQQELRSKEEEEKEQLAAYVKPHLRLTLDYTY
jgi:ubiquitin-conjugating enzyme (huntingtin interacting protein 2)